MKLLGAAIWVWWCVMVMMVVVSSLAIAAEDEEISKNLGYSTVTFELKNGVTGYSNFLTRLRNQVEAPTKACGIQSTKSNPSTNAAYVLVKLQISNTQWVTLGIDAKDLYVWGYQDNMKYNGNYRATFLSDARQAAKNSLFPGSTKRTTRFGGNYNSLEPAAGVRRQNLVLGIQNLDGAIRNVYGKQEAELNKGNAEARFFLIAIQMVAEAARFKFMEQGIVTGDNTQAFKVKMVAFQNDWDAISTAIHNSEAATPKCGTFPKPLQVGTSKYETVDCIKNDMGILKFKATKQSIAVM